MTRSMSRLVKREKSGYLTLRWQSMTLQPILPFGCYFLVSEAMFLLKRMLEKVSEKEFSKSETLSFETGETLVLISCSSTFSLLPFQETGKMVSRLVEIQKTKSWESLEWEGLEV